MASKRTFLQSLRHWACWAALAVFVLAVFGGVYLGIRLSADRAESFRDPVAQFKYGSTGGDKNFGIPYVIWQAMPVLFKQYLPKGRQDEGWAAFGFIYEDPANLPEGFGRPRPVGTSLRNFMGIERTFVNCAICHTGTVRTEAGATPILYVGMGANRIDLQAFQDFMIAAALDERFTPEHILAQIDDMGLELDLINRLALRVVGIYQVRERILTIAQRFRFAHDEPAFGPGRFDTFSPAKALLNWPLERIPERERIGVVDFPSIWLQAQRDGMQLHWDGNNTKLEERNRSAAFGTGALPPILDRESVKRVEEWLLDLAPPPFAETFPGQVDEALLPRGQEVYEAECAACHGQNGRDFAGEYVGKVTPIGEIGTDRHRFDNYTYDLAVGQNVLYAEFGDERFQNFRKTDGYANMPLDGVWLRAPYLHNGSVPTLWDLLQPPDQRPAVFYRGYDVYDPVNAGYESRPEKIPAEQRAGLFCFQTRLVSPSVCATPPQNNDTCSFGGCAGNGNGGHTYGTALADTDKRALVEYLKTF
jgi:hypothetical protein